MYCALRIWFLSRQQLVPPVFGSAGPIVSPAIDLDEVFAGKPSAEEDDYKVDGDNDGIL